jgi:hypothetical protein
VTDFLIIAVVVETILVALFAAGTVTYRRARRNATACDFPGCLAARAELRRLADEHDEVPSDDVLAAVELADPHRH